MFMKIKYREIEDAFDFVSYGMEGDHSAILDRNFGTFYFESDLSDFEEISDEVRESKASIEIPHKKELDLGNRLVFRFVRSVMPDEEGRVRNIFSGRGAYARYKDWLEFNGLLQQWYDFEAAESERALREWCSDNHPVKANREPDFLTESRMREIRTSGLMRGEPACGFLYSTVHSRFYVKRGSFIGFVSFERGVRTGENGIKIV